MRAAAWVSAVVVLAALAGAWRTPSRARSAGRRAVVCMGIGKGAGPAYSWLETEEDIEVSIPLPPDVESSKQLDIKINSTHAAITALGEDLVTGKFRKKVALDGTFWTLDDGVLILHVEKRPPMFDDDFTWGGVFSAGEDGEGFWKHYQEEQTFDLDEYVDGLGGYNESLVDKTMFGNVTQQLVDSLKEQGVIRDELDDLPDNEEIFKEVDNDGVVDVAGGDGDAGAGAGRKVSPNEKLILDKIREEFGDDALQ